MARARRPAQAKTAAEKAPRRAPARRANRLEGKRWLQNSISVWSDLRKTPEEQRLGHPAMFPGQLVERLIESFLPPTGQLVLDPFAGSGSTLVTAGQMGFQAAGCELSPAYVELARQRLAGLADGGKEITLFQGPASEFLPTQADEAFDLCLTSPPYWNILNQQRTADGKTLRHYGNLPSDLGIIDDYRQFLEALADVFELVFQKLKPGAYCCVIVMDLRKRNQFFPFHSDLAQRLQQVGFLWDDLIIWNRQAEYNNLRPLGYPAVFRVNKVHEFVVVLQKPRRV